MITFCLIAMVNQKIRTRDLWTNELIGVLWEGNNMFEGVAESMKLLREKGWKKTFDINVY